MTTTDTPRGLPETGEGFRHEAMFYGGEDDFVHRMSSFIRLGLEKQEPTLVVVSDRKIGLLRSVLGRDADDVLFADMAAVGRNPGAIIPAWHEFVGDPARAGRPLRGIGEPIVSSRSPSEVVECERHEELLNLAFADAHDFWLVCPYDTTTLQDRVLDNARRTHPRVSNGSAPSPSPVFRGIDEIARPFDDPLPEPGVATEDVPITLQRLDEIRLLIGVRASTFGLSQSRIEDLILCVNEIATNSVRHGGGRGVLRLWQSEEGLTCEVRDAGRIEDPLAGRRRPATGQDNGYGLWLVNQLCDLVQVRVLSGGTVVRMLMRA